MPNFILTRSSIILCSHGGMVTHAPLSYTEELINGEIPMLLNDLYFIVGCPFLVGDSMSSCLRVVWISGSTTKQIGGIPVLTNASVGICQSAAGVPQGPAIIAAYQTIVTD